MQIPPPAVIEGWPEPNYIDPQDYGPSNIIVTSIFFPLACIFVALRIYNRMRITRNFGLDDWLAIAAMFPATVFCALTLVIQFKYKWNRHVWDVPLEEIAVGLQLTLASILIFIVSVTLTKLSMLNLIYQIAGQAKPIMRKIIFGAMVIIGLQGWGVLLGLLFRCRNPKNYWSLTTDPKDHCLSETNAFLISGTSNSLTDLLVVFLSVPVFWTVKGANRQGSFKQLRNLLIIFGAGLSVTIAGAIRTRYMYKVDTNWDKTWWACTVWLCSAIELYIGILYSRLYLQPSAKVSSPLEASFPVRRLSRPSQDYDVELHGRATYHETTQSSGITIAGHSSDGERIEKKEEGGSRVNVEELGPFGIIVTGSHRIGTPCSSSSESLQTPADGQVGSGLLGGRNEGSESMVELVTFTTKEQPITKGKS